MTPARRSGTVDGTAVLDKALDVLDAIGTAPQGLSQAELAARLPIPRTTLYRLLATLVARGLVRRDPLRRVYGLGWRCFEYARSACAMPDLASAAGLELRGLRDLTGETSYLAVLDGREVLSLERCDGAHTLRSQADLGQRKPLHCTSQGKAILSAMPVEAREAIVRDLKLDALTPRTITDRRRLQAELQRTAARGYAVDDEEIVLGVRCVGAPIVDTAGQVRGAISVAGPAFRLTRARLDLLGPEVVQAARRIGAQLATTTAAASATAGEVQSLPGTWAFHGAFPHWCAASGRLLWVDTLGPAVHAWDGVRDQVLLRLDEPIERALPLPDRQGLALATAAGWQRLGEDGMLAPWAGPSRWLRALGWHPGGGLWGCQADGERWRIGAWRAGDAALHGGWHLGEPVSALAWDGDGTQLFALAPGSGTLYRLNEGRPGPRRLATVPPGSGRLGGLALDRAGGVWVALTEGWGLMRFGADGALDRVVGLPVPCPTDLALGGADGQTLFITSAREGLGREALASAPMSGQVFHLRCA